MSTKNLAKTTAINKRGDTYARRHSNRIFRHSNRAFARAMLLDEYEDSAEPEIEPTGKWDHPFGYEWGNNTSPVKRFLAKAARNNESWDDVYSRLRQKSSPDSLGGSQLIAAAKGLVKGGAFYRADFPIVDGKLTINKRKRHYRRSKDHGLDRVWASFWLNKRKIRKVGEKLYWAVSTVSYTNSNGEYNYGYRQGNEFSKYDYSIYAMLSERQKFDYTMVKMIDRADIVIRCGYAKTKDEAREWMIKVKLDGCGADKFPEDWVIWKQSNRYANDGYSYWIGHPLSSKRIDVFYWR